MTLTPRRRTEDRLHYRAWIWLRRVLVSFAIMVLISLTMLGVSLARIGEISRIKPTDTMVLTYALDEELAEVPAPPSLRNPRLVAGDTLHDVIEALDLARSDERVKGVVMRLDGLSLSLAQVQELRAAVIALRQSNKFAVIHAADYGGMGSGGVSEYYLASAFSDIWVQPVGGVALPGMAFQVPFLKTLLDKLGMQADMIQKGDYKSAPESLTATAMSAPARQNLSAVLASLNNQVVADIALARGMDEAAVRAAMQTGLLSADEALASKLVSRIGYLDEAISDAKKRAGQNDDEILAGKGGTSLMGYLDLRHDEIDGERAGGMMAALKNKFSQPDVTVSEGPAPEDKKHTIALITAVGEIVDDSAASAMAGDLITPDALRKAFHEVRQNDDIAAIVLRIDSPGGSAFASEAIRRLIVRARQRGIPVVVSMSGMAASGGYWIASAADHIVAMPATLTGSIGVFGGKVVIDGTLDRIGVNIETIKTAPRADMLSALRPLTADERVLFDKHLQLTYDAFITRVAEGRKMDVAAAEKLAGGQVFSGQQAKQNGLVDTLGGLDAAIGVAKSLARLAPEDAVDVVEFPKQRSPIEQLFAAMAGERVMLPFKPETLLARPQAMLLAPVSGVR